MTQAQDLEPVLAALVARISRRPAPSPNAESVGLADRLSSAPLSAYARALGSHLWSPNFGSFETGFESMDENGFYDEIVEALAPFGLADAEGVCIGTTGGGEEALLMVADDSKPGGYMIFRYSYDGAPYSSGEIIQAIGQFEHLLRELNADGKLDPELRAVLADAGITDLDRAAPEAPAPEPPTDGLVLRRVEEPVWLSDADRQRFAATYDDPSVLDAIKLAFRSPEGRLAVGVTAYPGGKYINHMLLADVKGNIVVHITDANTSQSEWCATHPTAERALVGAGTELFEMDLRTGAKTLLGPRPGISRYLILGGRERVLGLAPDGIIRVWAHTPGAPLDATPLAQFPMANCKWYDFASHGADAFLRPLNTAEGLTYHLVKFVETDTIKLENQGRLHVLDRDVDASRRWVGRNHLGVDYYQVHNGWFVI